MDHSATPSYSKFYLKSSASARYRVLEPHKLDVFADLDDPTIHPVGDDGPTTRDTENVLD